MPAAPPGDKKPLPAPRYAPTAGTVHRPTLALFIDRPHLREQVRDDATVGRYTVVQAGTLADFTQADRIVAADVVLVDCPLPGGACLAALARHDLAACSGRPQLIVNTSPAGLEDVFGCLDQSRPQLLVDATAAELALALGWARARCEAGGVRDMADADRHLLLQLAEQVSRLAARLDRLARDEERESGDHGGARADRSALEAPAVSFRRADEEYTALPGANSAPRLPPAGLVRQILRQRAQRSRFFPGDLFADPAWDMLLDLTAAAGEGKRVPVTSLCIASGVPATTALRWIRQMTDAGLLARADDPIDRRRAFIALSPTAAAAMGRYFSAVGRGFAVPL